jgi:Fic family protein
MATSNVSDAILAFVRARAGDRDVPPVSANELAEHLRVPRPTINRHLARLVKSGALFREGTTRGARYGLGNRSVAASRGGPSSAVDPSTGIRWSQQAHAVRAELSLPLASRVPVSYQRGFVDEYVPNRSALLPAEVAERLYRDGRAPGQQPAGTYARKVLEQLLIDLSWHSSRLEGNRLTLLDTRELFARGRAAQSDIDSTMLLNHKEAIEFMVNAAPELGITVPVVRNVHSVLMQGLLADAHAVGAFRRKIVNISHSVYVPYQVPLLLEEILGLITEKARLIRNPIESAFFIWVNIAYLQPFEDGNQRTSRLSANLPLFINNCAPLSFLDVSIDDYAYAMLGIYERLDVTLAAELFEWTYLRSIDRYRAVRDSLGAPDPFRVRYRDALREVIRSVVGGDSLSKAVAAAKIPTADRDRFTSMLREELRVLEPYNCARFRLSIPQVERWISRGRRVRE